MRLWEALHGKKDGSGDGGNDGDNASAGADLNLPFFEDLGPALSNMFANGDTQGAHFAEAIPTMPKWKKEQMLAMLANQGTNNTLSNLNAGASVNKSMRGLLNPSRR